MHDHAGTVIGGSQDSRLPKHPRSISPRSTGRSSRMSSNTISGGAQSSPMIINRLGAAIRISLRALSPTDAGRGRRSGRSRGRRRHARGRHRDCARPSAPAGPGRRAACDRRRRCLDVAHGDDLRSLVLVDHLADPAGRRRRSAAPMPSPPAARTAGTESEEGIETDSSQPAKAAGRASSSKWADPHRVGDPQPPACAAQRLGAGAVGHEQNADLGNRPLHERHGVHQHIQVVDLLVQPRRGHHRPPGRPSPSTTERSRRSENRWVSTPQPISCTRSGGAPSLSTASRSTSELTVTASASRSSRSAHCRRSAERSGMTSTSPPMPGAAAAGGRCATPTRRRGTGSGRGRRRVAARSSRRRRCRRRQSLRSPIPPGMRRPRMSCTSTPGTGSGASVNRCTSWPRSASRRAQRFVWMLRPGPTSAMRSGSVTRRG